MTDTIDVAQRRQQEQVDHALAARRAWPTDQPARTHCANLDCDEAIAPVRQQMGAQLCIDCQRELERGAQLCARGAI